MNIEAALNEFINTERIKYPALTVWDVKNLSYGFACGAGFVIQNELSKIPGLEETS